MEATDESNVRFIDRDARKIEFDFNNSIITFPLNPIPDELYLAIATQADGDFPPNELIERIYNSHVMKPSVCTFTASNFTFPINSATKIVRLTHKDEVIENILDEIEGELLSLQGHPFEDTIVERTNLYKRMFVDDSEIDRMRLGAIEMYGDITYSNLQKDPRVSIQFDWRDDETTENLAFQLNCVTEIVKPGTLYYKYMRALRTLFSSRFIDLKRSEYVAAYKFWVCEWREKSLKSKPGF